jgi:hypothetical protein
MKTQVMKFLGATMLGAGCLGLVTARAPAQGFSSGSDGSYGPMNITSNTTLNLPPDGKFHCTTINIASNVTLRFTRNPLNTPVYLLATGNVTIAATALIDLSGKAGTANPPVGGEGGPGGYDGGLPGFGASVPPGAGHGPGAGKGGNGDAGAAGAGSGSYGGVGTGGSSTNKGAMYGGPLLVPMAGGSGGGGTAGSPGSGGGGGGGAILIASSTRIDLAGVIRARGAVQSGGSFNGGSGGAIRLVAPVVAGNGSLDVADYNNGTFYSGGGRIRIDSIIRTALQVTFSPSGAFGTIGANMVVFPSPLPRLDIIEAAGTTIPEGTANGVLVNLPFGSATNRTVTVQARDFNTIVPINVVLTPDSGPPVTYPATIDNLASNPAQTVVNVVVPVNTVVNISAWTR